MKIILISIGLSIGSSQHVWPAVPQESNPHTVQLVPAPRPMSNNSLDLTIQDLYKSHNYPAMVQVLQTATARIDAPKYRALLALAALRSGDRPLAQQQVNALSQRTDEEARKYLEQLTADLQSYDEALQKRDAFLKAVAENRAQEAKEQAANLALSEQERQAIGMYLKIFRGEYGAAREQLATLSEVADIDPVTVSKQIDTLSAAYGTILRTIHEEFLYSPAAVSFCDTGWAENEKDVFQISIMNYEKLVAQLNATAPLADSTLDLLFHAQLLLGKYPALEQIGDKILAAKEEIRIPFYSKNSFFTLVIDSRHKKIRTEPDPHSFYARYAVNGYHMFNIPPGPLNKWNGTAVPFEIEFDKVASISQKAGANDSHLAQGAYALRINNSGTAPHYALMHTLSCTQGPVAQKTATRNLGQYILHVIGKPQVQASLQDTKAPSKLGRALSTYGQLAAIAASGQAATPLGQMATLQVLEQAAQEDVTKNWVAKNQAALNLIPPMAFASPVVASHFKALIDSLMSN